MEEITGFRYSGDGKYVVLSTKPDTYTYTKTRQPLTKALRDKIIASVDSNCEHCSIYFPYLEIHHRNHDPSDNDLENLIAICPNCHVMLHREFEDYE